jgi:hypothetical protein
MPHSLIKGLSGEADGFQSAGAKDGVVTMGELKDYMNISMPNETQKILLGAKIRFSPNKCGSQSTLTAIRRHPVNQSGRQSRLRP